MANTIRELRGLTDDELIERHDKFAVDIFTTKTYLDELKRRHENRHSTWIFRFTAVITIATVINVGFAVCDVLR